MMDKDLLREDPDGWSRPCTPKPPLVAVLPNEDIRTLFAKWQREEEKKRWQNPTEYGFKGWELE